MGTHRKETRHLGLKPTGLRCEPVQKKAEEVNGHAPRRSSTAGGFESLYGDPAQIPPFLLESAGEFERSL